MSLDETIDETIVSDCISGAPLEIDDCRSGTGHAAALTRHYYAFASQRLAESAGGNGCPAGVTSLYFGELFKQGASMDIPERRQALGDEVGMTRSSPELGFFSVEGDTKIGVELAAASASTWMQRPYLPNVGSGWAKATSRLDWTCECWLTAKWSFSPALASCMMFDGWYD